jgi:hypothetical protein
MSAPPLVVPVAQDALVAPTQGVPEVSLSRAALKAAWLREHSGKSQGTTAYWAKRAADKDILFASDSDSENDGSSPVSFDSSMSEVTPAEQLIKDKIYRHFSHAHDVWNAIYDLHGWTKRVQCEWISANIGLGRHRPWRVLTLESRITWYLETFPPQDD